MFANLLTLLKTRVLITIVAAILVVGGTTAALAATPPGQHVVQSLTQKHAMPTTAVGQRATPEKGEKTPDQKGPEQKNCPGLADAQNLAAAFHLSTASTGSAVQAICSLHQGTFKGNTSTGASISSTRVYGYGEIDQLLTLAQFLASHDTTGAGTGLTDMNVSTFLAAALHTCSSNASIMDCLKDTIPNFNPGNGNGHGRPTVTPTPHH